MTIKDLWHKFIEGDRDGKETEFLPSILEVTETPPSPVGRLVLWTLIILLVAGLIWAFVGEVDEVSVAKGRVIPVGNVKTVQSQNKGIIKELNVREGEYVEEGQTLLVLDTTKTQADVDSLGKQVAYYDMTVQRLQAEMNDASFVPPTKDVDTKDVEAQVALYRSRRAKLAADLEKTNATIAQAQASIESARAQLDKYNSLYAVSLDKEQRLEELYNTDAVSYFQLLEARSKTVEYQKTIESTKEEIVKEQAKLAEAQDSKATAVSSYKQETMTQLVEAKKQLNTYQEELKKANETNVQSVITAPVSGRVNQLNVHTIGGVVGEGQSLMMIVPDDATLEIEAYADNKDIGFIQIGQEAEVKVETFNFQKFGMVNATVEEISPDAVEASSEKDKDKNGKYRLTLSLENDDSGIDLTPGMNVSAEIKIKKKRIIDFFLDPFRQYQDEAFRER